MTRLDYDALKDIVDRLAQRVGVLPKHLPTYRVSDQDARPHVEIAQVYHYVVAERGRELQRRTTAELDLLLYWIFRDATWGMATAYEVAHRRPAEDFRRQFFARHVELMDRLSASWGLKLRAEQADTLVMHTYRDG